VEIFLAFSLMGIDEVMSTRFKYIDANALAVEAARIMQESSVYVLIVKSKSQPVEGMLKMHDLLQSNVV
jgi:arabinose-5-phosphate isomerase